MPYVLLRVKRGKAGWKPSGLHNVVLLESDLENLENNSPRSTQYKLVNTTTRRIRTVKGVK